MERRRGMFSSAECGFNFLFRQGASARADEVQRDGKESLGTLQLA